MTKKAKSKGLFGAKASVGLIVRTLRRMQAKFSYSNMPADPNPGFEPPGPPIEYKMGMVARSPQSPTMAEMSMEEYQSAAARTMNERRVWQDKNINAGLGLCGECGEIYAAIVADEPDEVIESELGDALWYLAALMTSLDRKLSELSPSGQWTNVAEKWFPSNHDAQQYLWCMATWATVDACKVAEAVKKTHYHNRGDQQELMVDAASKVYERLDVIAMMSGLSMSDIAVKNIEKLKARHPDGNPFGAVVRGNEPEKRGGV